MHIYALRCGLEYPYVVLLVCVYIYSLNCVVGVCASERVLVHICVWSEKVNICIECFCLRQVREDGKTITQTIQKLVIQRFKSVGFQEGLSGPKHIPGMSANTPGEIW